ncbi:MAG TPA: GNAT family N-acetyltransferase [Gemmatimonadaceae bacterium]|nr:GNAT family N-acetyltransferase [Gemmatimonadaceae bacterium]
MPPEADADVVNNELAGRFELPAGDGLAVLEYRRRASRIVLVHTEVPPAFQGRGYGSRLIRAALEHARAERLTVVPSCRFVRAYLQRHAEFADLLDPA